MDHHAQIKRKRNLMQLRDLKEKMQTVLFQIAALERSESDPHDSLVSPQSTPPQCLVSRFAVIDSVRSQKPVQRIL